jgi:hypothetical protein
MTPFGTCSNRHQAGADASGVRQLFYSLLRVGFAMEASGFICRNAAHVLNSLQSDGHKASIAKPDLPRALIAAIHI